MSNIEFHVGYVVNNSPRDVVLSDMPSVEVWRGVTQVKLTEVEAQKLFDHMWAQGMRWSEQEKSCVTINGRPASDYMSPSLIPEGYYTVISYLARHNPEAMALIGDLAAETQRDGFWLQHQARKQGLRSIKVRSPKVLQEHGIDFVNAYPVELLRRRFD